MKQLTCLLLSLLVASCGNDSKPIDASKDSDEALCDYERVTCVDRGVELFVQPPEDCGDALERWQACGLSREDVTGCVEAMQRCQPDPDACEGSTAAFCGIPECLTYSQCALEAGPS